MTLVEVTKRCLGDYAPTLLEHGAVVPLRNKKPLAKWSEPIDPHQHYPYNGLAFKTGPVAGITVIDFDASRPEESNVSTRRGGHVWVPYDNDPSKSYRDRKVDIRGARGLAIFYSPTHKVEALDLRKRSHYSEYLSIYIPRRESGVWEYVQLSSYERYMAKVKGAGYTVNVSWATECLVKQVASAQEGNRNLTFYRNLSAVYLIGGDMEAVIDAAYECGLPAYEIEATTKSVANNPQGIDIFELAYGWLGRAKRVWDSPVADELAKAAIEQHTLNPLFNQERTAERIGMPLRTFKSHVRRYVDAETIKRKVNRGRQANGNHWPNNFQLLGEKE